MRAYEAPVDAWVGGQGSGQTLGRSGVVRYCKRKFETSKYRTTYMHVSSTNLYLVPHLHKMEKQTTFTTKLGR